MKLVKNIMKVWENMVESSLKETFVEPIVQFREVCRNFSKFLNYVGNNILNPLKRKIVRTWTNHVLHLDKTTTNTIASTHERLKTYSKDTKGDFVKV